MRVSKPLMFSVLLCSPVLLAGSLAALELSAGPVQPTDSRLLIAQADGQDTGSAEEETGAAAGEEAEAGTEEENATAEAEGEEEPAPEFTEAFLQDPAQLATGKELWDSTCQHCHGAKAYPGKAPKLRPSRYDADFVYDRVTHGFRKMPGWKDVFTQEERMAITAYVLSPNFSP